MKKYSIVSILFIGFVGLFVYINSNNYTTMSVFGINIDMPNAVWMMSSLFVFYIFSIIFMAVLRYKNFKFDKNVKKDIQIIKDNIKNKILGIDKFRNTQELHHINNFVKNIKYLNISPIKDKEFKFFEDIEKLQKGEEVELKKYKLSGDNEWVILNQLNKLNNDENYAKTILRTSKNETLLKKARDIISKSTDLNDIIEFNIPISKDVILNNIENKELPKLLEQSKLKNSEYIEIAQKAHEVYKNPEILFSIFEKQHFAYVYLLIEFEVIDKALEVAKEYEIKFFEYYLILRENGYKIDIKEYINDRLL